MSEELEQIKVAYKNAKGRKLHAKATPLREGVIVIDEDTTMNQLMDFATKCEMKWGLKPLQIYMHKDEGHWTTVGEKEREWKPNLHAHIVWRWCDEIGVTRKLAKQDMAEMQTLLAECLQMKRGVSSDKKHLQAMQFKNQEEEKRLQEIERAQMQAQSFKDLIEKVEIPKVQKELKETAKKVKEQEKTIQQQGKTIEELEETTQDRFERAKEALQSLEEILRSKSSAERKEAEIQQNLGQLREDQRKVEADKAKVQEEIKVLDKEKESKAKELKEEAYGALGYVAKKVIGIKEKDQQRANEELLRIKEVVEEAIEKELRAKAEVKAKQYPLDNDNDKQVYHTLMYFGDHNEPIGRVIGITRSAYQWGINQMDRIWELIEGKALIIPKGYELNGEEVQENTKIEAGKIQGGGWAIFAFVEGAWLNLVQFINKLKDRRENAYREARAKEIAKAFNMGQKVQQQRKRGRGI